MSATAVKAPTANAWTGGAALSAGGGRGLAPALKAPLRVVAHIDMDAFYAQIEQLRDSALIGRPVAVVQYPTSNHNIRDMAPDDPRVVNDSASSIIAVSYEARPFGVKRNMKAADAQKLCPELILVQVPTRNGKADISLYRHAGEKVVSVLERAGGTLTAVEKASIDEVYVDVTRAAQALLSSLGSGDGSGGSSSSDAGGAQEGRPVEGEEKQLEGVERQKQKDGEGQHLGEQGCETEKGKGALSTGSREGDANKGCRRWEEIGPGGWAAVVSETATTHIAAMDRREDGGGPADEDPADGRISWWSRPQEAFAQDEALLGCGAAVVSRLRAAVRSELGYSCTAGVAHNKLLAKLCSNMHKPNAQTVLPSKNVGGVFHKLPVERVRGWGGKLGVKIMEKFGVSTAGEVAAVGVAELQRVLGDEEGWRAWEKSNAVCRDPVKARSAPKSVGCSKTFPGKARLTSFADIERWMSELSKELVLRLCEQREGGGQTPTKLTVSFAELQQEGHPKAISRCCRMVKPEVSAVVEACMRMVRGYKAEAPRLIMLGVSAHGFADARKNTPSIQSFFGAAVPAPAPASSRSSSKGGGGHRAGDGKPGAGRGQVARQMEETNPSVSRPLTMGGGLGGGGGRGGKDVGRRSGVDWAVRSPAKRNALGFPPVTVPVQAAETVVEEAEEAAVKRRRLDIDGDVGGDRGGGVSGGGFPSTQGEAGGRPSPPVSTVVVEEGRRRSSDSVERVGASSEGGGPSRRDIAGADDVELDGESRRGNSNDGGKEPETEEECAVDASGDREDLDAIHFYDDAASIRGASEDNNELGDGDESQLCEFVPGRDDGPEDEPSGVVNDECVGEGQIVQAVGGERWEQGQRLRSGSTAGEAEGGYGDGFGASIDGGGSHGVGGAEGTEHRPMFGRGGSSGVFGEVDPEVLAELPPEIQREIWMQQGGRGGAGSGQPQLRFFSGGDRAGVDRGSAGSEDGGGPRRAGKQKTQQQHQQRRRGRSGGRGRGGAAQPRRGSREGSGSISSFFGGK